MIIENGVLKAVRDNDIVDGTFTFPGEVTRIGKWAFKNCSTLKFINIPNGIEVIDDNAFENCSGLHSFTSSNDLKIIGRQAFLNCTVLEFLSIQDNLWLIRSEAFKNCTRLKSFPIKNGIKRIDRNAFENCISLESFTVPKDMDEISEETFYNCTNLRYLRISNEVKRIGRRAFAQCASLHSLVIPGSCYCISSEAFKGCRRFFSITIPNSVHEIYDDVFDGCENFCFIVITSREEKDQEQVISALPRKLRNRVITEDILNMVNKELNKILQESFSNPIRRSAKNIAFLFGDISKLINLDLAHENPYYAKAEALIGKLSPPKNESELKAYQDLVHNVVNEVIEKSRKGFSIEPTIKGL